MKKRIVRAILDFKTPSGTLRKHVNWSYYEKQAILTPSSTSLEAYNKFFRFGKSIIGSSSQDLRYLDKISFYEEYRNESYIMTERTAQTNTINIVTDNNGTVTFRVLS